MSDVKREQDGAIIEEDGVKTDNLHRNNIEKKDFKSLQTALSNGNYDKAVEVMAEIVAGSEVLPDNE